MCLLSTYQISLDYLFKYELSPVRTSLFDDTCEGRYPKNKSTLMKKLKVEISMRNHTADTIILDGCAVLYRIYWPKDARVSDFIDSFIKYVGDHLQSVSVNLIFDRCTDYSIKSQTRLERLGRHARSHVLTLDTPLSSRDNTLKATKTKVQLINLICTATLNHFTNKKCQNKLIVTGQESFPVQTHFGVQIPRRDMQTSHEEADVIIRQQVNIARKEGQSQHVKVICDDTDVFVLLLYYYVQEGWKDDIYMESLEASSTLISIKKTVENHKSVIPWLPAMHALSGCGTVPSMVGIGKVTALKVLGKLPLRYLGNVDTPMDDISAEVKQFVARCYGVKDSTDMSRIRLKLWKKKADRLKKTSNPKLRSLPPTNAALDLNIKRAHYHTAIWKSCLQEDPPQWDPCKEVTKTLSPLMVPDGTKSAPDVVLQSTRCNCDASRCKTNACSCSKAQMTCSEFCCCAERDCENKWNEANTAEDESDDDGYEEDDDTDDKVDRESDEELDDA